MALYEEWYAKSGKLLKTIKASEVKRVSNRWYPPKWSLKMSSNRARAQSTSLIASRLISHSPLISSAGYAEEMNIIMGAGPAGLGAALAMKKPALILERNRFAGKKLLLSGSGQCNVTNAAEAGEFLNRLGEFKSFLMPSFYKFSNLF